MDGHSVETLIGDVTPINAGRLLVIAPVNIGEALGIGSLDNVQQVIRVGSLENRANPLPALYRVAGKVEDDRDAVTQEFAGERPDQGAPLRGSRLEVIVRPDLEPQRIDPLVFADHHRGQRPPQLAGQL